MKGFKSWIFAVSILHLCLLSGCGSLTSVMGSDQRVKANLSRRDSTCDSVSRIYSGVVYNFCFVNGKPSDFAGSFLVSYFIFDSAFSAALDAIFLPYTFYSQLRYGSIPLGKQSPRHREEWPRKIPFR